MKRELAAAIAIPLVLAVLFLAPPIVFNVLVAVLTLGAVWEFYRIAETRGHPVAKTVGIAASALVLGGAALLWDPSVSRPRRARSSASPSRPGRRSGSEPASPRCSWPPSRRSSPASRPRPRSPGAASTVFGVLLDRAARVLALLHPQRVAARGAGAAPDRLGLRLLRVLRRAAARPAQARADGVAEQDLGGEHRGSRRRRAVRRGRGSVVAPARARSRCADSPAGALRLDRRSDRRPGRVAVEAGRGGQGLGHVSARPRRLLRPARLADIRGPVMALFLAGVRRSGLDFLRRRRGARGSTHRISCGFRHEIALRSSARPARSAARPSTSWRRSRTGSA